MTIESVLKSAYERLADVSDTAQLDAQLLLAYVLQVSTTYFYTWPDKSVAEQNLALFEQLMERRLLGEPIAYILGEQDFWSLNLETSPCTLIPRADTERLVEVALDKVAPHSDLKILDLGTGTGAIALALAQEFPMAQVLGLDFNENAVALAKRNAERNQIRNASFIQSDWFSQLEDTQRFSLIVSNPPYIDPQDKHLSEGDVRFEPKTALIAEEHGLADIRHIITHSMAYLEENAWLMFEHGYDQGESVRELLSAQGFSDIETYQDLGGNDRVTVGYWRTV